MISPSPSLSLSPTVRLNGWAFGSWMVVELWKTEREIKEQKYLNKIESKNR